MKILKHGTINENHIVTCKECGCIFGYYDSDIIVDMSTPDEEALCGGFGVHSYVECPECKCTHTLYTKFNPTVTWVDKLCDWFKKRKEKHYAKLRERQNKK